MIQNKRRATTKDAPDSIVDLARSDMIQVKFSETPNAIGLVEFSPWNWLKPAMKVNFASFFREG
jgi:hypothetical protein